MPLASDMVEFIRSRGTRAVAIPAGVIGAGTYYLVERIRYSGTSGALAAPSVTVGTASWQVMQTVPVYGVVVAVVSSLDVGELIRPGDTVTVTLVGGGNSTMTGYAIPAEVFQQWCAANNRTIP